MPLPQECELFYGLRLTKEQKEFVDSIFDYSITFVNAKAGTGKTTLSVGVAKILYEMEGKELFYTFSPVEERRMGFRPGGDEDKELAYLPPLFDALEEVGENVNTCIYRETNPEFINKVAWVTARSHVFLRGTNIKDKVLIIDEAQNMTTSELRKILTRVHDDTKVVVIGHDGQCDLPNPKHSGFVKYLEHYKDEPYANVVELTHNFRGEIANHADKI